MTKENGEGFSGPLPGQEHGSTPVGRPVTLGPYTYTPGREHCSSPTNGTLTKCGLPVTLQVTEPVLQRFLGVMTELETNLARRWIRPQGTYKNTQAK
ncbi:hypothetical protein GCM10010145_04870 [Streptomyces ruber]|uniref:Uncharacterized protein n=2 Tax=Streptomyces TaxID=1883 RepID=A0A918EP64_9ACTN|nr:hypothetical protein GCM10010145_04870 [Streptomyces ruber]